MIDDIPPTQISEVAVPSFVRTSGEMVMDFAVRS